MGEMVTIHALQRERGSRGQLRRLRQSGLIPGVCYGHGQEALALSLPEQEARQRLGRRNGNTLVQLLIAGEDTPRLMLLKEIQRNPLDNRILHIDFQAVNLGDTIEAEIPIVLNGENRIAKNGWTLSHQLREVKVECLPGYLPEKLDLEVGDLQIGDKVTAGDLPMPEQVNLLTEADAVILVIMPPGKAEAPPAEPEGEAEAEPKPEV